MDKAILYIHGKGGSPKEASYYKPLFREYDVIGFDYKSQSPQEAEKEFPELLDGFCQTYKSVTIIANSIGAFFAMNTLADRKSILYFSGCRYGKSDWKYDAMGQCNRR